MWAFNGGRGAHLCRNCRTMVCEGIGADAPLDDAAEIHRLSAVVGKPCQRLFCSARCAAAGGLSANEHAPAFSALRVKMGHRPDVVSLGLALKVAACGYDDTRVVFEVPPWLEAAWKYRPRGWLAFCERLRDAADARDRIDAACRLGGYAAALPLLKEFEEASA